MGGRGEREGGEVRERVLHLFVLMCPLEVLDGTEAALSRRPGEESDVLITRLPL